MAQIAPRHVGAAPTSVAHTGVFDGDTIFSLLVYKSYLFGKGMSLIEVMCPFLLTPFNFIVTSLSFSACDSQLNV